MGLAASQARLLTITARKSDCEYESMRLSHEKIALSRDMERISAEYDNAIAQTKLVWDYYGKDSETTPLNYALLMTPSALNNYTPSPITDSSGRVVLDDRLATAARAAGIPQEGLDGLPSSDVRNQFIDSLVSTGYISEVQGENIKKTTYNQMAGVGSTDLVNVNTTEGTLQDLIQAVSGEYFDFSSVLGFTNKFVDGVHLEENDGQGNGTDAGPKLSFADILSGNYMMLVETADDGKLDGKSQGFNNLTVDGGATDVICNMTFWDQMFDIFESLLDTGDEYTQAALDYARRMISDKVTNLGAGMDDGTPFGFEGDGTGTVGTDFGEDYSEHGKNIHDNFDGWRPVGESYDSEVWEYSRDVISNDWIGLNGIYNQDCTGGDRDDDSVMSMVTINLSNMVNAYLTYFAQYMEGIDSSTYEVNQSKTNSNLIDDMFTFTLVTDVDTSGDNLLIAAFWDTLFNQICTKGWTENDNVNNQDYLQESLKNGSMYISSLADDGYYYQGNYATHTYIQEVTDEEGIAQAEARYNREKTKINTKENILDMKMKNLDTEISSLSTEYDTIKSVISKNIEKGFKRYNA